LPWTIVRAPRVLGLAASEASLVDRTTTNALRIASRLLGVVGGGGLCSDWAPRPASELAQAVVDIAFDNAASNRVVDAWPVEHT
jgi:hypothetical protein